MKIQLPRLLAFVSLALLPACESQAPKAAEPAASASSEPAIEAGLAWLARHQLADGSWRASGVDADCNRAFDPGTPKTAWSDHFDVGSTALGALAFLRAGKLDDQALAKAFEWLRAQQNEQGFFSKDQSFLYNEALATLVLVEHYGATKDARELAPAQRAVDFLVRAQRPSPSGAGAWGWRYQSRMEIERKFGAKEPSEQEKRELYDSDVSITGWAAAALSSAVKAGLKVDPAALQGAAEFVRWCRARDGLVGYNDPRNAGLPVNGRDDHFDYHPADMSAIALRMANELGENADDSFLAQAQARVAADAPQVSANRLSIDYYYWLNGTLALSSGSDSKALAPWTHALHAALLGLQEHNPQGCGNGGWLVRDRWSYAAGPIYTTAMALLALEQKG